MRITFATSNARCKKKGMQVETGEKRDERRRDLWSGLGNKKNQSTSSMSPTCTGNGKKGGAPIGGGFALASGFGAGTPKNAANGLPGGMASRGGLAGGESVVGVVVAAGAGAALLDACGVAPLDPLELAGAVLVEPVRAALRCDSARAELAFFRWTLANADRETRASRTWVLVGRSRSLVTRNGQMRARCLIR